MVKITLTSTFTIISPKITVKIATRKLDQSITVLFPCVCVSVCLAIGIHSFRPTGPTLSMRYLWETGQSKDGLAIPIDRYKQEWCAQKFYLSLTHVKLCNFGLWYLLNYPIDLNTIWQLGRLHAPKTSTSLKPQACPPLHKGCKVNI